MTADDDGKGDPAMIDTTCTSVHPETGDRCDGVHFGTVREPVHSAPYRSAWGMVLRRHWTRKGTR